MPSAEWLVLVNWEQNGKPILPGLRVECNSFHNDPYPCSCEGKGYLPTPENLETLLTALRTAGIWGIMYWDNVKFVAIVNLLIVEDFTGVADTPLDALMAATLKMKTKQDASHA